MASATYDVGHACAIVSCCPLPAYERLVLAGGEGRLTFLKSTEHEGDDDEAPPVLKRLDMKCELSSTKIDAVAWGHDPVAGELRLASAGGGMLSVHFLNQSLNCEENAPRADFALPPSTVAAGPLRSACFLERAPDRLALTGDTCCAIVLQLAAGHGPVIERTVQLRSPGVAVRTHPREPQQLMIAQEDGAVHFVDLRAKGSKPSLSRGLAPGDAAAGGLRDADWSPFDVNLIGGVCGGRWVVWDLRRAGLSPPPQSGDSQPSGALAFRWAPGSRRFATAGTAGGLHVHTLQQTVLHAHAPSAPASTFGDTSFDLTLSHELPTRVASLSWLHTASAMLVGAADSKVCVWTLGEARLWQTHVPASPEQLHSGHDAYACLLAAKTKARKWSMGEAFGSKTMT
uniref:Uncharacterized protein n=1 Tax=Haptolina brevifila TaxID=156173 RepID=A0A7S2JBT2_9EUKA